MICFSLEIAIQVMNGSNAIECICSYNETHASVFTISFLSALSQIRELEKIA